MKILLRTMLVVIFLNSCTKPENGCALRSFQITSNSPVNAGDDINLSVNDSKDAALYNWYGPNGFSSHTASPSVPNASGASAGVYTVDIVMPTGCIYSVSDTVIIGSASLPCSMTNDHGSLSGVTDISFSYVQGTARGGSYFIEANGDNGDAEFEFAGISQPVTGIYTIQPLGGEWLAGDVHVSFTAEGSNWSGGPGKVYVNVIGNKVTASFCSVNFSASSFSFMTTGSLMVSEQ